MASEDAIAAGWELMADAGLVNEPEATPRRLVTWVLLFEDWTDEQFSRACIDACRTRKFFPTPSELRECLNGSLEVRATEAWELVRAAISRHGSAATLTAADLRGDEQALWCVARIGAEELGNMTSENRAIKAAEFRRLYSVACEKGYGLEYLPGLFETQNRASGLPMDDPALIGRPGGLPARRKQLPGGNSEPEQILNRGEAR